MTVKEKIFKALTVEQERIEQAKKLGIISVDPVQFFVDNIDMFLNEIEGKK